MKSRLRKNFIFSIAAILFLGWAAFCFAAMGSTNYGIPADTVNSGGNQSTSTNYKTGDTVGEAAIGVENSTNYSSKTAFWYMIPGATPFGLSCQSSTVYMVDYTLGDANNYNKYLFSPSASCTLTTFTNSGWTLTMQSTNMTSARNNLANTNVNVATDGSVATGDTVTTAVNGTPNTNGVSETGGTDHPLNSAQTVIYGDATAIGSYSNQPTIKLTNLNSLYAESISGTLTITLQ